MELDYRGFISRDSFLRKTGGAPYQDAPQPSSVKGKGSFRTSRVESPISVSSVSSSGAEIEPLALESRTSLSPSAAAAADKATTFTAVAEFFLDDVNSKLGDWACGYTSLLLALGYDSVNSKDALGLRHVDIGCGKGSFCNALSKSVGLGEVVGVDVVSAVVAEARRRYCPVGFSVQDGSDGGGPASVRGPLSFDVVERASKLGSLGGLFDSASACFVLSGLRSSEQQLSFLQNASRVLKPGGTLSVLVNNPDTCGTRFTSIQLLGDKLPSVAETPTSTGEGAADSPPAPPPPPPPPCFVKGQRVRAHFFNATTGEEYLQCNDRWWPRSHYLELFRCAGFTNVTAMAVPFGPAMEPVCALLGVQTGAMPAGAAERTTAPVLCITGTLAG